MKRPILYGILGVAVLEIVAIVILLFGQSARTAIFHVSPSIMSLTKPVTVVSGTVNSISGTSVNVAVTTDAGNLNYNVAIDKATAITRPPLLVPFLFSPIQSIPVSPTREDIKPGMRVTVQSPVDLRTVGSRFHAVRISLPELSNSIEGDVIHVDNNILYVRTYVGMPGVMKEYAFTLNDGTEISRADHKTELKGKTTPVGNRFTVADLKPQTHVIVWTGEDVVKGTAHTALRIEPITSP